MKLQEIRDDYISGVHSRECTRGRLSAHGIYSAAADEILDLWRADFEAEVVKDSVAELRRRRTLIVPMKLEKIRELYLSLRLPGEGAIDYLTEGWTHLELAGDLLLLWVSDEWDRSVKHVPDCIRARAGRE